MPTSQLRSYIHSHTEHTAKKVGQGNLTKSSESLVPIRKRKHPSPSKTDDDPQPLKRKKPVTAIATQSGGDLGSGFAHSPHTLNREDSPGDAPPHPPFEEIEMWVPTPTAKFGPPKRKHAAARARDPTKEPRTDSVVSTGTSARTQAPLNVSKHPIGPSESQIIALREEEEESQSQPHRSVSRRSPKMGSPTHDATPSDPLQTFPGDAMGEAGEKSQEVRNNHPANQLSTDSQPIDRNASTSHATNPPIQERARPTWSRLPITIPTPGRNSLVNPENPAVIAPSTKSLLPEKQVPRPITNSTPNPYKSRSGSGTLAQRRAFDARARLDLVRRAAAHTAGNFVEGRSSASIAPQIATSPPPHVELQQVLSGLESPSQSQAAVEKRRAPPFPTLTSSFRLQGLSEPREAGPSVESEDKVTQDKSNQYVNLGEANLAPHDNQVMIHSTILR